MMSGALMMADVRISRADRSPVTEFGVRKLQDVAPIIMAGFAGSVGPGLRAIEMLRASLPSPPPNAILQTASVARVLRTVARRVWHTAHPVEKQYGLEFMMIGAGLRPQGFPGVFRLRVP